MNSGNISQGPTRRAGMEKGVSAGELTHWFPQESRYERRSEPLAGGMGIVFKALDTNLDVEVAIKRIRPEFLSDADLISRFEREAKAQRKLRHPNLVQVLDYAKDQFGPYIVLDWIEGRSLATAIENDGAMGWKDAAALVSKVADALQVAHEAGIIHRDVKPANILLNADGKPFITDFGLARIETTQSAISETATSAMLGTINFISPEQQRNPRNAKTQSDIWSLGATLYKLLTTFDITYLRESLIPEPLRAIVLMATEHRIESRFGTMRLMSQALKKAVALEHSANPKTAVTMTASETAVVPSGPPEPQPTGSSLADQWRRMREQVERTQTEARVIAETTQDYATAARMLESVPEHLRDADVFQEMIRRRDRVAALDGQIQKSVATLQSTGLREAIQELLDLQPNRTDMQQLLAELPAPVSGKAFAAGAASRTRPPLLVAPFDARQARAAQEAWANYLGIGVEVTNGLGMKFRVIPPGTFDMGSPTSEPERTDDEDLHKVTITQPKLLGVYPVTQGEWTKLMGSNPSHFNSVSGQDTSRFPVEQVSWDDCQEFLSQLNQSHGMKGWRYRLPTEAEWEYACRAGTEGPFWFGGELNGKQANCDGNHPYQSSQGPALKRPGVVGAFKANPFGLCDQHGQVWEWCEDDWYGEYAPSASQDPMGPSSGSSRVLRGGSWCDGADFCRSAGRVSFDRSDRDSHAGFRVLCELS